MQPAVFALPVILLVLFPKSGSGFGLPLRHRLGVMDHMLMFGMDPRVEEMLQENAFDDPEFQQIKLLCEEYVKGADRLDLHDHELEYSLINECEKYQQGRSGYAPILRALQQKVTVNPMAAKFFNKKH
ncbi:hypothetical protein ACOMHN_062575 [Nucella lapillus]